MEQQKEKIRVVTLLLRDADVFAVIQESGNAERHVQYIRGGRH